MPYTWLVLGIGYSKAADAAKGVPVPNSWRYCSTARPFTQRIALLSESADLIRLCAKYQGISLNDIPDANLTSIEQMLIRQKPHVKAFHEDDGQDLLASGEIDIVLEYNGDMAQLMSAEGGDRVRFRRAEGRHADQLGLPVHPDRRAAPRDAHAFINYLLDRGGRARRSPKRSSIRRRTQRCAI